jgi:flagellin
LVIFGIHKHGSWMSRTINRKETKTMSLVIGTNLSALEAQNSLATNITGLNTALQQLSTGNQINSAADDSSGLEIAQSLQAQINGTNQAASNAADGNNLLSVADGTLSVVQSDLQRIRELAVQAANGTNGSADLEAISKEIQARVADITQITNATQFNGLNLLQTQTTSTRIQVGANGVASLDTINISSALGAATATGLGMVFSAATSSSALGTLASNGSALSFLNTIDTALTAVGNRRATIGSLQNRLESASSNLQITNQNFQASFSQIMDTNVAAESTTMAKYQILEQTAASVLSQANQTPDLALTLIKAQ